MLHPSLMTSNAKGYLATLDGWRAVAILAVIADHGTANIFQHRFPKLFEITRFGPNGVSLFFAISGFLICSRLLEEYDGAGRISLRGFYIRRASRILPPALLYLAVVGVLGAVAVIEMSSREWWACIFFFRNYLPPDVITRGWGGYTIHYWSLAVEEHFYLLWPGILVLLGPRRAKWAALGGAVMVAGWRFWDFRHLFVEKYLPGLLFGSRTDVRLDGLLMGCLLALLLSEPRWRERLLRVLGMWGWVACAVGYLSLQLYYRHHYYTLLESVLLAAMVAATVMHPQTLIGKFLELGWMRWLGRLSYSLYLWQQLFLVPGAKYPWSLLQSFPVNCGLLLLVAALSYRFVERPMIRLGHQIAPPPSPGRIDIGDAAREPEVQAAVLAGEPSQSLT